VQGGSFSYYFPYIYSFTYADMENKAGNFFKGGGPGNFNLPYSVAAVKVADVTVKKGANQFGGTMRLLGFFHTQFGYQASAGLDVGTADWLFEYVGAGSNKNIAGTVTKAYTYNGVLPSATNKYQNTAVTGTVTSTVAVEAFGWTTGTATVTAKGRGPFPTVQKRKGVDNRTASGKGTIQLVSPMLTHWVGPIEQLDTGGIGFLKLEFVPEPENGMMLVAGVSLLGLLYRYRA
jgi:hypothetical protein